jgi:hypothetical protein
MGRASKLEIAPEWSMNITCQPDADKSIAKPKHALKMIVMLSADKGIVTDKQARFLRQDLNTSSDKLRREHKM